MMMPMTSEGHIRQTFASVVDLFGGLELSLNFPNGFHPGVPGSKCNPPLPVGVDRAKDLEPGVMHEPDCPDGGVSMLVGHVNCEYTDLMFVP